MMKVLAVFALALSLLSSAHLAPAQMPSAPPPPELKKVEYLAGTWNVAATAYAPDGKVAMKMAITFQNEWMLGHYFLVMRSTYMDGISGVAYMGYDKDAKVYTYDEFESTGYADHSQGTIEGDTWKWISGHHTGSASPDHFTVKILSPTSYSFKFESSADGTHWKTTMDGLATKAS